MAAISALAMTGCGDTAPSRECVPFSVNVDAKKPQIINEVLRVPAEKTMGAVVLQNVGRTGDIYDETGRNKHYSVDTPNTIRLIVPRWHISDVQVGGLAVPNGTNGPNTALIYNQESTDIVATDDLSNQRLTAHIDVQISLNKLHVCQVRYAGESFSLVPLFDEFTTFTPSISNKV